MGDEVDLKRNLNKTSRNLKPPRKCSRGRVWSDRVIELILETWQEPVFVSQFEMLHNTSDLQAVQAQLSQLEYVTWL